jgi:hypothetical protein
MVNDDALGRTLDAIHQYGVERFYSQLSVRSTGKLKLHCATSNSRRKNKSSRNRGLGR